MKRLFIILTMLMMLVPAALPAHAYMDPVADYADMLTDAEENTLRARLEYIRNKYGHDAAVVTVPGLEGKTAEAFADDHYDYNGYGAGSDDSGILLLISEFPRNYHITTHGRCFNIFNDAAIEYMCENVEEQLRDDLYFEGCMAFAEDCTEIIGSYTSGKIYEPPKSTGLLFVLLGVALFVAIMATLRARSSMKNARVAVDADHYVKGNHVNITDSRDVYLYSTVSKSKIERSSSSGSSGHTSSSGRTHGGGGGSY